jgi:hypothetical protein
MWANCFTYKIDLSTICLTWYITLLLFFSSFDNFSSFWENKIFRVSITFICPYFFTRFEKWNNCLPGNCNLSYSTLERSSKVNNIFCANWSTNLIMKGITVVFIIPIFPKRKIWVIFVIVMSTTNEGLYNHKSNLLSNWNWTFFNKNSTTIVLPWEGNYILVQVQC